MNRAGFSMIDLMVAGVLLVVVGLFSLAATANLDNTNTRVRCASNLRQIGQAILLYSNDTKGSYPRTKYDRAQADRPTAYTGVNFPNPFATTCPQVNDVSGALFLLLRTEDIVSRVFICPATGQRGDDFGSQTHTALDRSNFPSGDVLSYSYADPYPSEAAAGRGYKLVQGIDPTFVVVADMNPGSPELLSLSPSSTAAELRKGNSANHSGDGQNALYGDGHVEFQNNPFCGANRDNIYTYGPSGVDANTQTPIPTGGTGIVGSPVGPADSVLLPAVIMTAAAAVAPAMDAAAGSTTPVAVAPVDQGTDVTTYLAIASLIFLLVLLGALAAVVISRRRRARSSG